MNNYYRLYEVGGCVRDRILGIDSKDIDYTFEFTQTFHDMMAVTSTPSMNVYFITMQNMLKEAGFDIFLATPECFTIRAKFPKGHEHEKTTADFVLARKEVYLDPNSRTPTVEIGTLYDDLKRRDFTVNAIAVDEDGTIIDPFDGRSDIEKKILRCPVDAKTSFNDDPLRMLRALRFSITKGFDIDNELLFVIWSDEPMWEKFKRVVSQERIREEINKMFKHDTVKTLDLLTEINNNSVLYINKYIFGDTLWLKPTNEKR